VRARLKEENSNFTVFSEQIERSLALDALEQGLLLAEYSHLAGESLGIVLEALIENVLFLFDILLLLFPTESLILGLFVGVTRG